MLKEKRNSLGQSMGEYVVLIGIVTLALITMQTYMKRGIQAGIKIAADELGRQEDAVDLGNIPKEISKAIEKRATPGESIVHRQANTHIELNQDGAKGLVQREHSEVKEINLTEAGNAGIKVDCDKNKNESCYKAVMEDLKEEYAKRGEPYKEIFENITYPSIQISSLGFQETEEKDEEK